MRLLNNNYAFCALLILAAAPLVITGLKALIPASHWMEVQSVVVSDAKAGKAPLLSVERSIHKKFTATWVAEIHKKQPSGVFATTCFQDGKNVYTPTDKLPDNIDLNWWTYPTVCDLGEGEYRMVTVWVIAPENFPAKRVEIASNIFKVIP
ncbi:hypothetical protein WH95_18645 [Kiloniella litopenaei]|uniref:Uncharacterized protein n=1 Tax=Kiloniella litopenaei TaxID=1549748 RepID=A0A0M2R4T3_9PROT|nr:hypothetical protein [Kiloniella litopenaei]KKJ75459.1 hypothetical protein WH95_18645 [Kiloniella litopenaei]